MLAGEHDARLSVSSEEMHIEILLVGVSLCAALEVTRESLAGMSFNVSLQHRMGSENFVAARAVIFRGIFRLVLPLVSIVGVVSLEGFFALIDVANEISLAKMSLHVKHQQRFFGEFLGTVEALEITLSEMCLDMLVVLLPVDCRPPTDVALKGLRIPNRVL